MPSAQTKESSMETSKTFSTIYPVPFSEWEWQQVVLCAQERRVSEEALIRMAVLDSLYR